MPSQRPLSRWRGSQQCPNQLQTVSRGALSLRASMLVHLRTCRHQNQQLPQLFHTYDILSTHDLASTAYLLFTELVSFKFWVGCLPHSIILLFTKLLFKFLFLKMAKSLTKHYGRPDSSSWILFFGEWHLINFGYAKKIFFQKISSRWDRKKPI